MAGSALKQTIGDATTAAMKAREKARLAVLRLINADIQRVEVDERRELSDADVVTILTRMVKQRQDSLSQYEAAGRDDLAEQERYEIDIVREFLPEPLDDAELDGLIAGAIRDSGAESMRDMGKVMAILKPQVEGRADMGAVSGKVKARLNG
ncbi:MAG: GatB/YqeY domain-containing protein [Gammaproteobacteria bacterium]|nr:GatB/YqeY domain-containing protein [Gammaproteobacteria bacterium]